MAPGQKMYPRATVKKIVKAHTKCNVSKNVDVMVSEPARLKGQTPPPQTLQPHPPTPKAISISISRLINASLLTDDKFLQMFLDYVLFMQT